MADSKISALASGAPAQAGDEYVVARSGANYKLTGTNVAALVAETANTFSATQSFSVPAEFADGSASAPSVTNTGDTDTGVYFPAANEVAVSVGGAIAAAFNSNGLFFRNRIINGDMRIDQRNAGASVTPTASGYTLDRWQAIASQSSKFSVQQNAGSVTPPAGFTNYLGVTSLSAFSVAAGDYFSIYQQIEGLNVADLGFGTANALTVTISFWVRSSLTGTFGGSLKNPATRSYPFTYTIFSANTWEKKTITIAGDTTGTWATDTSAGLLLSLALGVGATYSGTAGAWAGANYASATGATSVVGTNGATFYITGVQLETGSVATPFERRPYTTELQLCQRYYERLNSQFMAFIPNGTYLSNPYAVFQFLVQKRAAPTLSTVTGASLTNLLDRFGIGAITPTASTTNNITAFSCRVEFTTSASYATGESFSVLNDYWQASAEL